MIALESKLMEIIKLLCVAIISISIIYTALIAFLGAKIIKLNRKLLEE